MLLRKSIKEGLILLVIYSIITLCLFMCADRMERLDKALTTNYINLSR